MLDLGLLFSGVVMLLVVSAASRWAPSAFLGRSEVLDRLYVPAVLGILGGRVAAAALDDPGSLRSVRALLVIRGGVEFWPGVAVTTGALAFGLRRRRVEVAGGLAELAPYLLWGYASYEITCLVRDGCYGPASPIGLVPEGLTARQFPIGLVVGATLAVLATVLRQLWSISAPAKLLLAVGGLAAVRSVASFWLPRLGDGLSRPHLESAGVLTATVVVAAAIRGRQVWRHRRAPAWAGPSSSVMHPRSEKRRS